MSNRRILPAFLLAGAAGFLGVHRLYAGRYVTGLIQLILFAAGALLLWRAMPGLESLQTLDQAEAWMLEHPLPLPPVLMVAVPAFWAIGDCALLIAGKFRDGKGNFISRWL